MSIADLAVTAVTVLATGGIGVAAAARAPFVVTFMREVGVSESWLPRLATLKLAGALGLLAGLAVQPIGIAAGVGLVLYFIGAVTTHIRARVFYSIGFPATYLGLSIASLALAIAR
jgi:hypothetical protein